MKKLSFLTAIVSLLCFQVAFGQLNLDLSGSYSLSEGGVTLTLIFKQTNQTITGSLKSTSGVSYAIEGQVEEGIATGVCYDEYSGVYFEAYAEGNELVLSLIEPDEFNMPDYNTAQYLSFTKTTKTEQSSIQQRLFSQKEQNEPADQSNQQWQHNDNKVSAVNNQAMKPSGDELTDPSWGFAVTAPEGWIAKKTDEGVLMGHNSIAGMIIVMPHMINNIQQMQQEMMTGLQEEGVMLSLSGTLEQLQQNGLTGLYTGYFQGEQAKAKGVGLVSPFEGGAFIMGVTTPEKFGEEISSATTKVAKQMRFFKPSINDLMRHFAGEWATTTGYTSTWLYLYSNGIFSDQYEASYSGNFSNGGGDVTGNWGVANQESSHGKWVVRGNKQSGQIIIVYPNGEETIYNYKVHVENGETYWSEYWMNGNLYQKRRQL